MRSACKAAWRRASRLAVRLAAATAMVPALSGCAVLVSDKDGLPNPPPSIEKGEVFLFAGFTLPGDTVIRSGTYRVTQEIRADGVRAEVSYPSDWEAAARGVIANPDAARMPIAVVGYSLGASSATKFTRRLQQAGIPVDTLVVVEAYSPVPLSCNIRRAVDIYNSEAFLSLSSRLRPGPGFEGARDEVPFSKLTEGRYNLDHWSIITFDGIHRMIRDEVLDGSRVRRRAPLPHEGRCLAPAAATD